MINNRLKLILFFCLLCLFGCEETKKPPVQEYSGYFRVLLKNEMNEQVGEHTYTYKHMFVQAIKDSCLFADISQSGYPILTDSLYYISKSGDILMLPQVNKNFFVYSDKYFPTVTR